MIVVKWWAKNQEHILHIRAQITLWDSPSASAFLTFAGKTRRGHGRGTYGTTGDSVTASGTYGTTDPASKCASSPGVRSQLMKAERSNGRIFIWFVDHLRCTVYSSGVLLRVAITIAQRWKSSCIRIIESDQEHHVLNMIIGRPWSQQMTGGERSNSFFLLWWSRSSSAEGEPRQMPRRPPCTHAWRVYTPPSPVPATADAGSGFVCGPPPRIVASECDSIARSRKQPRGNGSAGASRRPSSGESTDMQGLCAWKSKTTAIRRLQLVLLFLFWCAAEEGWDDERSICSIHFAVVYPSVNSLYTLPWGIEWVQIGGSNEEHGTRGCRCDE